MRVCADFPWQAGTGSFSKCTGRCFCLLHTFLVPSSFCNNNNNNNRKPNKEENPDTFKLATSINREGCRRADATRPLEAGGWLHPLPSGTYKDTWGLTASQSWGDFGNGSFISRNKLESSEKPRRGGLTHGFWSLCLIFIYSLAIDLIFLYFM